MFVLAWLLLQITAPAGLPTGQIIADVKCASDPSQSYALFVPADYSPARAWPVIFAFDPGARGRTPVERYQSAASQYGFIVAGSNNSRNGSPNVGTAIAAMTSDVLSRFQIDPKRVYLAGMSGGARVALGAALGSPQRIAGVIASSAGYPDGQTRNTLPFPVFATAGTEDFNHLEMRRLDGALTSPHHLAIFEGGHTWLSADLAVEAIEWMEIWAMKSGLAPRDETIVERIFTKRTARISASGAAGKQRLLDVQSLVADFDGLREVSSFKAQQAALERDKSIRAAVKKDREEDDREEAMLIDLKTAEARLAVPDQRAEALAALRLTWRSLFEKAKRPDDSSERRLARRVLAGVSAGVNTTDAEYLKIINQYRFRGSEGSRFRGSEVPGSE